jgi:hypothetical protein
MYIHYIYLQQTNRTKYTHKNNDPYKGCAVKARVNEDT